MVKDDGVGIKKEDQNLDRNLDELEEGTKARNRAFQRRLVSSQIY